MATTDRVIVGSITATAMASRGLDERGRPYWRARGPAPERRLVKSGRYTREALTRELALISLEAPPTPKRRSRSGSVATVADLLARWLAHQEEREKAAIIAPRTMIGYRKGARPWQQGALGGMSVHALRRPHVQDEVTRWIAAGVAPRTADKAAAVLSQAWAWGAERGHCPALKLAIPAVAREGEYVNVGHTPTQAEVLAVLAAWPPAPVSRAAASRAAYEIASLTGARISEVLALRVGDVEPRRVWLHGLDPERENRGKTGRRPFPLSGRLAVLLGELVQGRAVDDRLITLRPRGAYSRVRDDLAGAFLRLDARRLDGEPPVTPFSMHGLRRSFIMALLDSGANVKRVARLCGMSVSTLLKHYVRPTEESLREAIEQAGIGAEPPSAVH